MFILKYHKHKNAVKYELTIQIIIILDAKTHNMDDVNN